MGPTDILAHLDTVSFYLEGVILILLPLELLWLAQAGRLTWPRLREMAASASPFVLQVALGGAVLSGMWYLYAAIGDLRPWPVATNTATAALCLVLVDFLYYWEHRLGHQIRGLWALYHSVHHSSGQFDQTTALRVSIIDTAITPLLYLPAILVGFDPLLVLVCFGLVVAYQTWIHTEAIGRLGWFDRIFNSPSNHRVHHAVQRHYLDKNYGAILIIWDRLFGTYEAEGTAPVYGLTDPLNSSNPIKVHFHEIAGFLRDWRQQVPPGMGRIALAWRMFWHRPGWRPCA